MTSILSTIAQGYYPPEFIDPITWTPLQEPVKTSDGLVISEQSIDQYLQVVNQSSESAGESIEIEYEKLSSDFVEAKEAWEKKHPKMSEWLSHVCRETKLNDLPVCEKVNLLTCGLKSLEAKIQDMSQEYFEKIQKSPDYQSAPPLNKELGGQMVARFLFMKDHLYFALAEYLLRTRGLAEEGKALLTEEKGQIELSSPIEPMPSLSKEEELKLNWFQKKRHQLKVVAYLKNMMTKRDQIQKFQQKAAALKSYLVHYGSDKKVVRFASSLAKNGKVTVNQ